MRILKFLFSFLFLFVVLGMVVFFAGREGLLFWGVSSVEHSLGDLQKIAASDRYIQECQRRGGQDLVSSDESVRYQLRFLSSTEYVLEAVCSQFSLSPILIDRRTLPQLVSKAVGSSGFIWRDGITNSIELVVFGELEQQLQEYAKFDTSFLTRKKAVVVADRTVMVQASTPTAQDGPVTSCQGYGYQCCDAVAQIGTGDQIVGLQGCEQTCYAACVSRPVILSFNSNPFFDVRTRVLSIPSGGIVEFLYVADGGDSETLTANIDFGDGKQAQLEGNQNSTSHTYTCAKAMCTYQAKIRMIDRWGVESTDTAVNTITVEVTN